MVVKGNEYNPEIYKDMYTWQEGEYQVFRTTQWSAPGCHNGCGVLFYVKDGKVERIEGDPKNGWNCGTLCMRCLDILESMYDENRLKYPMKRASEDRGKNKWERISWDEAYDIIEEKVRYIQKNYGHESIIAEIGTGRNVWWQVPWGCFAGLQSPNQTGSFLSGDSCYSPRSSILALMSGEYLTSDMSQMLPERYESDEWTVPECITIWGCNPIISNGDGYLGHWIVEAMKRGSELVVVDPRINWLGAKAKHWLRLRPGTDAALAMALLNVMIKEELCDYDFISKWTYGFEDLAKSVEEMTPARASEICWVPEQEIIEAARFMARSKPMAMHWGVAIDQQPAATPAGQALICIAGVTGQIDNPGGSVITRSSHNISLFSQEGFDDNITDEQKEKRLGMHKYPMRGTGISAMAHTDVVLEAIESDGATNDCGKYPIMMQWMQGCNPISNMAAEAPRVYDAICKVPFNVVVDVVMTPTAMACADLLLPCAMGAERDSIRAWWWPLRAISKVAEYYEAHGDEQILLDLVNRLNPAASPGSEVTDWLNDLLVNHSDADFDFEHLKQKVIIWPDWHYNKHEKGLLRYDGEPGFNTPTGKLELRVDWLEANGLSPVPFHEEPHESPYSTPDLYKDYPLVLTTGARSYEYFHSEHRNLKSIRAFHPDPLVEIHPDKCKELGIDEGDWVWIENQRSRCRQRVKFNKGLDARVVAAEHGWWFPESDPERLFNVFDSNINNLTTQCDIGKSGYGAAYKCLLCKIYKCTEENSLVTPTAQVLDKGGFKYERKTLA